MRNITTPWLTAFCLCVLSSYYWPTLPPLTFIAVLAGSVTIVLAILLTRLSTRRYTNRLRPLAVIAHGLVIGILWMASVGHWYYAWQLPRDKIQQDVIVTGTVTEANCTRDGQVYTLRTDFLATGLPLSNYKIRLYESNQHACMRRGDTITATVRLKPAYGVANPIGFNYQQYLVSKAIVATGELRQRHRRYAVTPTVRHRAQSLIGDHAGVHSRWLRILLLGDKSALQDDDWALLRRTGTGHLFSISGLHLGIVSAALLPLAGIVVSATVSGARGMTTRVVLVASVFVTVSLSLFYVSLAGAALPVVRAWLLLVIALLAIVNNRYWTKLHIALVMLAGCMVAFPLALLSAGFYLSIGAVAIIWLLCWRWQWHQLRWYQLLWRLQLALSVFLLPLTVGWFSLLSLSAIPVNLLLVPAMTVLLPVLLLLLVIAFFISPWSSFAIALADTLVGRMLDIVVMLDQLLPSPLIWQVESGPLIAAFIALVVCCIPPFTYRRRCIALLLLPLLLTVVPHSDKGWQVHVLDAGQGTAVVVTRKQRALVIDTGASFGADAPTAERALVPLLQRYNLTVDYIVISHSDNDHAGGTEVLRAYLASEGQTAQWLTPNSGCYAGETRHWQGLRIRILWPPATTTFNGNNASCVIAVEGEGHSVLLPGDIERTAEYALLALRPALRSDVMLAPHHGSATSSTGAFIAEVSPSTVIFTQGFENRWGFPARDVVSRYMDNQAQLLTTSESGYIRLTLHDNKPVRVESLRNNLTPRWYLRPIRSQTMD